MEWNNGELNGHWICLSVIAASQPPAQRVKLSLQAHDLLFQSLAAQALAFELLNGFAQRMDLGCPTVLMSQLPCLGTLGACQGLIAHCERDHPALLCLAQLTLQLLEWRGDIARPRFPLSARGE